MSEDSPLLKDISRLDDPEAQDDMRRLTSMWFEGLHTSWRFYSGVYLAVCANSAFLAAVTFWKRVPPLLAERFVAIEAAAAVLSVAIAVGCWLAERGRARPPRAAAAAAAARVPALFVWNGFLTGVSLNCIAVLVCCFAFRHELAESADDASYLLRLLYLLLLMGVIVADVIVSYSMLRFREGDERNAMGLSKEQMKLCYPQSSSPTFNILYWCILVL